MNIHSSHKKQPKFYCLLHYTYVCDTTFSALTNTKTKYRSIPWTVTYEFACQI